MLLLLDIENRFPYLLWNNVLPQLAVANTQGGRVVTVAAQVPGTMGTTTL